MSERNSSDPGASRRGFLAAAAAGVLTCGLPRRSRAQANGPFVRRNLSDPMAATALGSYEKAVAAMLQLPPTDPRNWYRNAFIHLLDCPHQNWWFLPWHRGYLGWFERTCRELSGDGTFALPYWDWTAQPSIPAPFSGDSVLNPSNAAYIDSLDAFRKAFHQPVADVFGALTPDQKTQLSNRGINGADDFWALFTDPNGGLFFPRSQARQPNFDEPTLVAVSLATIQAALAPADFLAFGSDRAQNHSQMVGEGILENQPHDNVHGAVGGFMSAFMSPVDPLFFMHHSNIDRLWDVWTRKQQERGLPTLPTGADLSSWNAEPFLFFVDPSGLPVTKTQAGDYATIGDFAYTYQPGSGEQVVPAGPALAEWRNRSFAGTLSQAALEFPQPAQAHVALPQDLPQAVAARGGPQLVARITLQPPRDRLGTRFHVLVNPPPNVRSVRFGDPSFAGTITPFGNHHHMAGPITFVVPLTEAVRKLRAADRLKPDEPLRVVVVPDTRGVTLTPFRAPLSSISVGTL